MTISAAQRRAMRLCLMQNPEPTSICTYWQCPRYLRDASSSRNLAISALQELIILSCFSSCASKAVTCLAKGFGFGGDAAFLVKSRSWFSNSITFIRSWSYFSCRSIIAVGTVESFFVVVNLVALFLSRYRFARSAAVSASDLGGRPR